MAISDAVMILSKCHRAASQAMNSGGKNLVPKGRGSFFVFGEFQKGVDKLFNQWYYKAVNGMNPMTEPGRPDKRPRQRRIK